MWKKACAKCVGIAKEPMLWLPCCSQNLSLLTGKACIHPLPGNISIVVTYRKAAILSAPSNCNIFWRLHQA